VRETDRERERGRLTERDRDRHRDIERKRDERETAGERCEIEKRRSEVLVRG
jgi:hypothetical protein